MAGVARAEVLADPDGPTDPALVREAVWAREAAVGAPFAGTIDRYQ